MKFKTHFIAFPLLILFFGVLQSCTSEDTLTEYLADDDSFSSFTDWALDAELMGIDPSLGAAHGGNNENTIRKIYFHDGVGPDDGEYPIGARIVKRSYNPDGSLDMNTAMVKRGNDYDPDNGDWEYFVLNADGSIATDADGNIMRGAGDLMGGMCLGCHSHASTDYIFSK